MLLSSLTSEEKCPDPDSESDNFSVDSLEAETGSSIHSKNSKYLVHKICELHNESMYLNQNYGCDKTNSYELTFESDTEQCIEANLTKVDIVLPSEPYVKQNEKTIFERKSVGRICQYRPLYRSNQSMSKTRYENKNNETYDKETKQFKPQVPNVCSPRSLSSDSASLEAQTSHRSQGRKTFTKLTPTNKTNKRSVSYLAQYREKNPHSQAHGNEDNNMNESPSQVSVITPRLDDESQFYSDLINGRDNQCGQSECDENGTCDHDLTSVISQDLKSVSEIQFDRGRSFNYVPYTVKDRLLVLPTKLGSLGPDPLSYKEKAESCKKRQQYGMYASLKNMEMIRHRNLKKKVAEAITDLHASKSEEDFRKVEQWEIVSNSHSSSSSKLEGRRGCCSVPTKGEISKKQPKYGCGKFKKKQPLATNVKTPENEFKDEKTESNLDLINKLLRDRHKNELIINTF